MGYTFPQAFICRVQARLSTYFCTEYQQILDNWWIVDFDDSAKFCRFYVIWIAYWIECSYWKCICLKLIFLWLLESFREFLQIKMQFINTKFIKQTSSIIIINYVHCKTIFEWVDWCCPRCKVNTILYIHN